MLEEHLTRIADALERIAAHLEGDARALLEPLPGFTTEQLDLDTTPAPAPTVTLADLTARFKLGHAAGHKEDLLRILTTVNVTRLPDVPPERYSEVAGWLDSLGL